MIGPLNKGLGSMSGPLDPKQIPQKGWNLLREDLSLPAAVLYESRLTHNLNWMRQFVNEYKVALAPHGKTTMTPRLFERQLEAGAWGITMATAHQALVAHEHGVPRVLMANQLVGRQNMAIVSQLLDDPAFEFFCCVDSVENVNDLGTFFKSRGQKLSVLIELGVNGGRSGVRDNFKLNNLLSALEDWPETIAVAGVELYEGVIQEERVIVRFLEHAVKVSQVLAQRGIFKRSPFILSAAGSQWFDLVAEIFTKAKFNHPVEIILRPGCYLTHDVGVYREAQERMQTTNPVAQKIGSSLVPAMHVWAYVQSLPEPGLAIVGIGKRDASYDAGLPTPTLHHRPNWPEPKGVETWETTKIMDQHAMMRINEGDDIKVGDMVAFDICHPCLTFDKWRFVTVVDDDYNVIEVLPTYF